MVVRFRVASKATGIRRQVFVHVYDDQAEMARAHTEARNCVYDPADDIGGGVVIQQGYHWPQPAITPIVVMRLWTGQLTTRTIAHEAVHAATTFFFMDAVPKWDTRARTVLIGDDEPLAYLVGDISSEIIGRLHQMKLLS